jgi:hypothetical protein
VAGFLGLPAGLFRLGRGSFRRPLGGFQAIPEALAPAPLAFERLLSALGSTVRLCESRFDYSHEPVMLCSKTGAVGGFSLFGALRPRLRSAAIRLRLIGPCALSIRTRFRHPPVGLCRVGSCLGPISPASFCVGAGLRCGCPLRQ